jgi:hypothetical protein
MFVEQIQVVDNTASHFDSQFLLDTLSHPLLFKRASQFYCNWFLGSAT